MFGLFACGFLLNNIVPITCPQNVVSRDALIVNPACSSLILAKGKEPISLKRERDAPSVRCPWEATPQASLFAVPSLLSISRSLDLSNYQTIPLVVNRIRNCRSPPTYSRDPLSDAMIGLTTPLCLRGDCWGAALVCEASHTGLISLQLATIPTFSTRKCLELLPTSNGSSRYTVRGQL
jgi:hypothetical protein